MALVEHIVQKTRKARQKQFNRGYAIGRIEGLAEWRSWNERRLQAQERGERFDDPFPVSKPPIDHAEDASARAKEDTWLQRLKRHWIWPHLLVLFTICVLVDLVALGFGVVWLVQQLAGIVGGGTIFITLLLIGAYLFLWNLFRPEV